MSGQIAFADPLRACLPLKNAEMLKNKIVIVERGDCMFIDKVRQLQVTGAIAGIVFGT